MITPSSACWRAGVPIRAGPASRRAGANLDRAARYIPLVPAAPRASWRALWSWLLLPVAVPVAPTCAQRWLPADVPAFALPIASPRGSGFTGRILSAYRGDSRFGRETEADVNLARNFPLLRLDDSPTPWVLDFGVGTQARFSLSDPKSALISNDWTVGFDAHGAVGRTTLALQLYHESSHLGDEYADHFRVDRLDWTREVAMGWVGYPVGQAMLRGALGYVLSDQLRLPRGLAAMAVDYRGRARMVGTTPARLIMGAFVSAEGATDWRPSTSLQVGIEVGRGAGHTMALGIVWHSGRSTQRQFYRATSRYLGGEIRFDF